MKKLTLALSSLALFGMHSVSALNQSTYDMVNADVTEVSEALDKGQSALFLRARIESDRANGKTGEANTLATRLRYATPYLSNFAGLIEFNAVQDVYRRYHNTGLDLNANKADLPIIDDAAGSLLNRGFLNYRGLDDTSFVLGRQGIDLDNGRFVSTYSFRQNPTSYDALTVTNHSVLDIELFYAYLWQVNNQYATSSASLGKQQHRSHLLNATYTGFPFGTFIGYTYLLHNKDVSANSSDTFGVRYENRQTFLDMKLFYSAEYAEQFSRYGNPNDYKAHYYGLNFETHFQNIIAIRDLGIHAGYEVLSGRSDLTDRQFRTVLSDAHAFQGTAGQFTTVPNQGLEDLSVGIHPLFSEFEAEVVFHRFWTESNHARLGHEWDYTLSKTFERRYTTEVSYAQFKGTPSLGTVASANKFWLTASATFK